MTKKKKINIPKKGAAKKWSQRLKEIGDQRPSSDLMKIINKKEKPKKIARPTRPLKDLDI